MLFDVLTGILNALFIAFSLIYPFRKKMKGKIGRLRFHCISGGLLVLITLIHINLKILAPSLSFGFIALFLLVLVALTGLLKRHYMKSTFYYYAHISCACIFILSFVVHAVQQIINLLLM